MNKTGVLVIGCGSIGMRHIRCFQQSCIAEVVASDTSPLRRQEASKKFGIKCIENVSEALGSPEIQAVVVATPAHTHIPLACEAAKAGRHLLIEKPLSLDMEGVDELVSLTKNQGITTRMAYVYRFRKVFYKMKSFIEKADFGRPLFAGLKGGQPFDEKRPGYENTYFANHSHGGGVIQDGLCHFSDLLSWFIGKCDKIAVHGCHSLLPNVDVEDTVTMVGEFGNVAGVIHMNLFQAPTDCTMEIHYEKGSIKGEMHNNRWGYFRKGDSGWTWNDEFLEEADSPFTSQAIGFLNAISGADTQNATLQDGIDQINLVQTALDIYIRGGSLQPINSLNS